MAGGSCDAYCKRFGLLSADYTAVYKSRTLRPIRALGHPNRRFASGALPVLSFALVPDHRDSRLSRYPRAKPVARACRRQNRAPRPHQFGCSTGIWCHRMAGFVDSNPLDTAHAREGTSILKSSLTRFSIHLCSLRFLLFCFPVLLTRHTAKELLVFQLRIASGTANKMSWASSKCTCSGQW